MRIAENDIEIKDKLGNFEAQLISGTAVPLYGATAVITPLSTRG